MRAHRGVETFCITLVRHFNQPARNAAIERIFPSGVLAPVDMPPWNLHLPPFSKSLHWQGRLFYSLPHRFFVVSFFRIAYQF